MDFALNFKGWDAKANKIKFYEAIEEYSGRLEKIAPAGFKGNLV